MSPGTKCVLLTGDQFLAECLTANFVGAYNFWIHFRELAALGDDDVDHAERILHALALTAHFARGGQPLPSEGKAAFAFFGLDKPAE